MIYLKKEGQKDDESFEEIDIVFCKNCVYWNTMECMVIDQYYDRDPVTNPEDFCAWGERNDLHK